MRGTPLLACNQSGLLPPFYYHTNHVGVGPASNRRTLHMGGGPDLEHGARGGSRGPHLERVCHSGKAVQVETHQVDPGLKVAWLSTS